MDQEISTDTRYRSRKFLLSLVIVLLASLLVGLGKIDGTVYGWIVSGVITAYIAGNVSQKVLGGEGTES